ncbi:MAG: hypothetical protein ACRDRP_20985 [Pseudonocardiaceae bacterium]
MSRTRELAAGGRAVEVEPEWARFIDTAYLAGEWATAFGDIARPVESTRFARHSAAEARNQNRARRGALSQAALSRAALASGHVDSTPRCTTPTGPWTAPSPCSRPAAPKPSPTCGPAFNRSIR